MDLNNKDYYLNRELSWLEFNNRVFEESQDKTNEILERLKFLGISASNLDEFFMVRVSGLMAQVSAGFDKVDFAGLTPVMQLKAISESVHEFVKKQYNCLTRSLLPCLEKEGIVFRSYTDLNENQLNHVIRYFEGTLFPILTPMAIDKSRPFPLLNNKSLNFIVELVKNVDEDEQLNYAVVQVPTVVSRILDLPSDLENAEFILIEEIIRNNISSLFIGYTVKNLSVFRITRNSDLEIEEEDTEDLLYEIEKSLKGRKWGQPVRLEIENGINKRSRHFLEEALSLDDDSIYRISGPLDLTVWMSFSGIKGYDHLKSISHTPKPSVDFMGEDIFDSIKKHDILVHHPYESFDSVIKFIENAANDPSVLAIKQTLYRVSGDSSIVKALINAAENGKQVTVLVELKARFDEENNIQWARRLEKSGCHVVYGLIGLKTHCKICLVVRREENSIKRYVHFGTGNYNDSTAKIYTDFGLFTCKETFGLDASALFNLLTGYSTNSQWKKIAVAPVDLRDTLVKYIRNEKENAILGRSAMIIAKVNSLVDINIIQELYSASIAGVKIRLIVRGICCLRSGIKDVSENISVCSVVGTYLEHSRIYYFENGGECKVFLSSADWMPRNLDRRVEVAFPIDDVAMKERVIDILELTLADNTKLRMQMPDGTYEKVDRRGKEQLDSQKTFETIVDERYKKKLEEISGALPN